MPGKSRNDRKKEREKRERERERERERGGGGREIRDGRTREAFESK